MMGTDIEAAAIAAALGAFAGGAIADAALEGTSSSNGRPYPKALEPISGVLVRPGLHHAESGHRFDDGAASHTRRVRRS
jgi:hypothetical protein